MFINKKRRTLDKKIMKQIKTKPENFLNIDIKIENSEQIFSSYNYNKNETLNEYFCSHLWNNAKLMQPNIDININIFSYNNINKNEVTKSIKTHYSREYGEVKLMLYKTNMNSLLSLILGIFSLALLIIFYNTLNNFYLNTIIEIIAWVFVWESADKFFYDRSKIKRKLIILQNLYNANITIKQ